MYTIIAVRFLKAFAAGFLSTASVVALVHVGTWTELTPALSALALSGLIGGITGLMMALEKYVNFTDPVIPPPPAPPLV